MKVIGINSSPRKKANTQTLVEAVLAGAEKNGAETRMVNLRELNINGCLGCEGCKKHLGKCVQKDDLTQLLQDLKEYDAIVMGTPVYWFQVSAQFKMLVDRLYCFMEHTDPNTGESVVRFEFPAGKKFVLVVSRGDNEPTETLPQLYDYMNEWLNIVPLSMGAGNIEFLHQYGAEINRKAAKSDADLIQKAEALGGKL
jgi:multimeric flavodoxin WrbA